MKDYYTGGRAQYYNLFWHTYTSRTLQAAETMIDLPSLLRVPQRRARPPRVLDVACGTGVLLRWLLEQFSTDEDLKGVGPDGRRLKALRKLRLTSLRHVPIEVYGVDASQDMLTQARATLRQWPHVHLARVELGGVMNRARTGGLPFQSQSFDLITCTNAFHYLPDPQATLTDLARLLAPSGQLVLQDYRERQLVLVSSIFKWLVRRVDPKHVRTYTLAEVTQLCTQAGFSILAAKTFPIDWLCDGWTLRASML